MVRMLVAALLAWSWCSPNQARAQNVRPLAYDVRIEPALTAVGGLLWVGSEVFKGKLAPGECRWCDDNAFDRRARSLLFRPNGEAARSASDVLAFGLVPVLALGGLVGSATHDDALGDAWIDVAIVLESVVVAANLTQLVKYTVARERPFVHELDPDEKTEVSRPADNNVSFFSGHSSLAFSLAISSAMVATLRGYRLAPVVWGAGIVLAGLTAYLRVAADRHYLSDVLVGGVAVGSAVGVLVPWLHARGASERLALSISPSHVALSYRH